MYLLKAPPGGWKKKTRQRRALRVRISYSLADLALAPLSHVGKIYRLPVPKSRLGALKTGRREEI